MSHLTVACPLPLRYDSSVNLRRTWLYILGSILILVAMYFLLRSQGISASEIVKALRRFRFASIALAAVPILFIQIPLQISRLWALLPHSRSHLPSAKQWPGVAKAFAFGQAINAFAPARAGDALKMVMLRRSDPDPTQELPLGTAAGVLLADKAIDILSLVTLSLFCIVTWGRRLKSLQLPHLGEWILMGSTAIAMMLLLLLTLLPKLRATLRMLWNQIIHGLAPLRNPGQSVPALLASMAGWCGELWAIRLLCEAQGYPIPFNEVLWAMVVLNLGVAVPISLANLGAFEAAMTLGLVQVGVPAASGLAVASAHHALQIVAIYLWTGVMALLRPLKASLAPSERKTAQSL